MRKRGRTDNNQAEIVAALRQCGAQVLNLSSVGQGCPDVLVGRAGRNMLLEIKSRGGTLTPDEQEFFASWLGEVHIVYSAEDALKAIGAL